MKKVLFSAFSRLSQDELLTYSKNVVTLMTANPIFLKLLPDVEELKACNLSYAKTLEENVSGGKQATAEKNKWNTNVNNQLKKLATYVSVQANSDVTIILAAGFDPTRDKSIYSSLDTPFVLELTNLPDTSLATIRLDKVAGATNYIIKKRIKTDDPNAPWDSSEYNSALKITLRVDVPQKNYQFIFRAIGNSGLASEWTQIYELFVS